MTRKDTILIAVVINAGLLAILFTTAVIYDTDKVEQTEFVTPAPEHKTISTEPSPTLIAVASSTGDEVDNVLKYYSQPSSSRSSMTMDHSFENEAPEPIAVQPNEEEDGEFGQEHDLSDQDRFVEVRVKKGDVLEKIARANKTTVGAIKRANNLQNERLSIGQVLKIPLKQEALTTAPQATYTKKPEQKPEAKPEQKKQTESSSEAVYYVIKSGDNPWKVAKQFNVKYEDILRLNQLDEEKARNLKIGDRIRVK